MPSVNLKRESKNNRRRLRRVQARRESKRRCVFGATAGGCLLGCGRVLDVSDLQDQILSEPHVSDLARLLDDLG